MNIVSTPPFSMLIVLITDNLHSEYLYWMKDHHPNSVTTLTLKLYWNKAKL